MRDCHFIVSVCNKKLSDLAQVLRKVFKEYMLDSWKIVFEIDPIGQLFTTFKKEANSRYSWNG